MITLLIAVLFLTACGTRVVWAQGGVTLYGHGTYKSAAAVWSGPAIWDDDFATKLFSEIPTYKNISFVFDQCFAGGFINDLAFANAQAWPYIAGNERGNLTISTSSRWDRYMYYADGPTSFFTFFTDPWNKAVDTPTFDNFGDAHLEAENVTRQRCITYGVSQSHPQYHSNPTQMDNLTLSAQPGDDHRYAIIFAGLTNSKAFYNEGSEIYNILTTHYGYSDNDIALLWGDGTHQITSSGATWNKIDLSATKQNLWNVLADMGASGGSYDKVGSDDRLLVYFVGHGGQNNSNITIASTLANFDVKNKTNTTVDDFHMVVSGIHSSDITGYYTGSKGWGNPTSVNYDSANNSTEITWVGSANDGDWVHHGVHLKSNIQPTDYEAWWTVGGNALPAIGQVPTQWQPQAGNEARAVILNMTGRPVTISNLEWAIVGEHIELNDLVWELEPEGGWILFEEERIELEPLEPNDPSKGYIDIVFDGFDYSQLERYTLLMRYGVVEPGENDPYWRNVVASHVIPEPDPGPPPVEEHLRLGFNEEITNNTGQDAYDFHLEGTLKSETFPQQVMDIFIAWPRGSIPGFNWTYDGGSITHAGGEYYNYSGNWSGSVPVPPGQQVHIGKAFNVNCANVFIRLRGWWTDRNGEKINPDAGTEVNPGVWISDVPLLGFDIQDNIPARLTDPNLPQTVTLQNATDMEIKIVSPHLVITDRHVPLEELVPDSNFLSDLDWRDIPSLPPSSIILPGESWTFDLREMDMIIPPDWTTVIRTEILDPVSGEYHFYAGKCQAHSARGPFNPGNEGLVAYYPLENDVLDGSGNELHGTMVGDPAYAGGSAGYGMALDLDGVDDYVDCGNDTLFDITEAFTLSVWINWRATGATWQTVIAKGDNAWRLARGGDTQTMDFGFTDGGDRGWLAARTAGEVPLGEWHHVTATIDTTDGAKIYLDGILEGTNPDTGGITVGSYPVLLGENAQATGRFWDGLIDEVMIYNRTLSDGEIRYLAGLR